MEKTFNIIIDNIFFNESQIRDVLENEFKNVHNIKICTIEDVYKNTSENFFYIVTKITDYLNFNYDETLMSTIPNNVKESLKTNYNLKLIFLELNESDFEDTIEIVDLKLKEEKIPTEQVYYICANHKLEQLKNKCNSKINVRTINHGQYFNCKRLTLTNPEYTIDKDFFFMIHNRNLKSHRVGILCLLKKYNLLDYIDWSLLKGSELKRMFNKNDELVEWFFPKIFNEEETKNIKNELKYLSEIGDKKSIYETEIDFNSDGYRYDYDEAYNSKCYLKSYINITTETNYESPYIIHITEKTFNPFNFYQIPIFVATYQHVKYLRDIYNFDMFDDLINHGYDNEIDNKKRLFMIVDEIKRLSENPQKIKEFYLNNKERFYKNREIIFKILEDKKDYNLFQNLI
jgi:hypothetical protein